MFYLTQSGQIGHYDLGLSSFHREYPQESFDMECPDNAPVESVLYYACGIIAESGHYSFSIERLSEKIKPRIVPEMSILLNRIDQLFHFVRDESCSHSEISFFEQGCEMKILFSKGNETIKVRINYIEERRFDECEIERHPFELRLCSFVADFIVAVGLLVPTLVFQPAFALWLHRCFVRPNRQ